MSEKSIMVGLATKIFVVIIVAGLILGLFFYIGLPWIQQQIAGEVPSGAAGYKYTTGLNAKLRVINGTSDAALTSGITVQAFASEEDPFEYKYDGEADYTGTYDSNLGSWVLGGVDAGSYEIVIAESSAATTMIPILDSITVSGTNDTDKEVWCNPSTFTIYNIATITVVDFDIANLTATEGTVDDVHLMYDAALSAEGINGTDSSAGGTGGSNQGDFWRITYDIGVSSGVSIDELLTSPIRLYWTDLSELFDFDKVLVDGTEYTISDDDKSNDDGYSGLYVEVTGETWEEGTGHTIQLFLTQASSEGIDGTLHTLTLTIAGMFNVVNTDYRSWSDTTQAVSCYEV